MAQGPVRDTGSANGVLPRVTLVMGGARSGKSRFAQHLVESAATKAPSGLYLATAEARDSEMAERIRLHRAARDGRWETVEEPLELAPALERHAGPDRPILVDCLTLWLSNVIERGREPTAEITRLVGSLDRLRGPVVLVANEVGLGLVPDNPVARAFRDHAGRLHQEIAARAERVVLVAAGLPIILKDDKRLSA